MQRYFMLGVLSLFVTACQATGAPPAPTSAVRGNGGSRPLALGKAVFSKPDVADKKGPPAKTWIFASNGFGQNVDVYDEKSLKLISTCQCFGIGLAVDPTSGDLAVASRSGVVTVWHVSGAAITQFATLQLSQGQYALGLAYDSDGNLYAGNVGQPVIDFFSASLIGAGGGNPTRSFPTSNLQDIFYLVAPGKKLLADGYDVHGQAILVSVNVKSGGDTVLQQLSNYGTLAEGIAVDRRQNLIVAAAGGPESMLLVFSKPWTGSPVSSFTYGSCCDFYYSPISLNKQQNTLWAGNYYDRYASQTSTNLQANSYPLGSLGAASTPIPREYYASIALDPQAPK